MRYRPITQYPFKLIVDREWKRAKKLLPCLRRKPKVVWATASHMAWAVGGYRYQRSGTQGMCSRSANRISMHEGYLEHGLHKEFVLTLRHEFAHLPRPSNSRSHGKDFLYWMKRLGGTRYCTASIKELAEQKTTSPEVDSL